jgi:hypothetical protein
LEFQFLRGARFKVNALEATQGFDGRSGGFGKGEIELHYFVACDLAGVGDFDGGFDGFTGADGYWCGGELRSL